MWNELVWSIRLSVLCLPLGSVKLKLDTWLLDILQKRSLYWQVYTNFCVLGFLYRIDRLKPDWYFTPVNHKTLFPFILKLELYDYQTFCTQYFILTVFCQLLEIKDEQGLSAVSDIPVTVVKAESLSALNIWELWGTLWDRRAERTVSNWEWLSAEVEQIVKDTWLTECCSDHWGQQLQRVRRTTNVFPHNIALCMRHL